MHGVNSHNTPRHVNKYFAPEREGVLQQRCSYRMVTVGTLSGISSNKLYDYE